MSMSFFTDKLVEVKTHKKEFIEPINRLIPWSEWVELIKLCYCIGERGNKPYNPELMLRSRVLQMVYNVADMAVASEVTNSCAFWEFCQVTSSYQVPNSDTSGRFRNILIKNNMQEKLFADVVNRLKARGLMLMKGAIVDSTLIAAPSSTKNNKKKARDPKAHQTKKGNQWYVGYKGHIGVDRDTSLANKMETTAANIHDEMCIRDSRSVAFSVVRSRMDADAPLAWRRPSPSRPSAVTVCALSSSKGSRSAVKLLLFHSPSTYSRWVVSAAALSVVTVGRATVYSPPVRPNAVTGLSSRT